MGNVRQEERETICAILTDSGAGERLHAGTKRAGRIHA